jgi:hypothetical protein
MLISLRLLGTTDLTSPVTSSQRRWSSLQLSRQISSTASIRSFGPVGCFSPCLLALYSSGHTPYVFSPPTFGVRCVLIRCFRPSIPLSLLDGLAHLSTATIISCLSLLSSGSAFPSRSYSHSFRGTSTWRGLSASILMTWISLIGTTN